MSRCGSPNSEEQSETGDLNKLSDDEFLHLLEEASTFNKPNNQESVLLKQLRKEVAETDPCDNVTRTKPTRVSDGSHSKRSKHPSGYSKNRESGLVRSGVTDSDVVSLPQRTVDYNVRRKNEKLGRSREYPNIKNNALTTSGLGKSGHQSQSLQDLVNSDLVKSSGHSYRKLQRAQRAASFSSAPEDQDSELEFETFRTSFKSSKRTKQQMHSSASFGAVSESTLNSHNKKTASSSKHEGEEAKSRNRKSSTFETKDSSPPSPLPVISTNDHVDSPLNAEKVGHVSSEIPSDSQEIEMKDISGFCVKDDHTSGEKESQNGKGDRQSNSKFYVNCADVDSPVTFPLKLVSTNGEINKSGFVNEAVNDKLTCQQVNFPVPWTRPMQVHSFLSSIPMDHETYPAKKEKQIFDSDVNGNPFAKASRTANITSFVSATLLDYPSNNTMISESQSAKLEWSHRKTKRTRNSVESQNVVFSENIAGHRGKESIDSLLKFINSSDKKSKNGKGANSNQTIISKSAISNESDKKKILAKGLKNCHNKNIINTAKKKLSSQSNSEEECTPSHEQKSMVIDSMCSAVKVACSESNAEPGVKSAEAVEDNLDVNSNITVDNPGKNLDEAKVSPSVVESLVVPSLRAGISSFAVDFYLTVPPHATQEVPPHAIPEDVENFCVVKKKQRKRHPGKRSESHRWRSAAARAGQGSSDAHDYYATEKSPNKNSMVLLPGMPLSQRNQCGKQDSRRKSTSSVPHSEQSSPDNSDLDSVHSLPVKGSARHPTQPQPHTSPSSSSSTPQASYADIAKMPVVSVKSSPPPFCASLPTSAVVTKSPNKDVDNPEPCEASLTTSELESAAQSKTVQTQTSPLFAKNSASGIVENEPSVPCARVSSNSTKSTRENNTQTDPIIEPCSSQYESPKDKNATRVKVGKDISNLRSRNCSRPSVAKDKNVSSICHCTYKDGICSCCSKRDKNIPHGQKLSKDKRPAVIMMDSCLPSKDVCGISFGVDLNELCKESSGENSCHTAAAAASDSTSHCASLPSSVMVIPGEQSHRESVSSEFPRNTSSATAAVGSSGTSDIGLQVNICTLGEGVRMEVPHNVSSSPLHTHRVILPTGQVCNYQESECSVEMGNYEQIVDFLSASFVSVEEEHTFYTDE